MNRRGGEGPMDGLEFQNVKVDESSPFIRFAQQPPANPSQNAAAQPFASFGINPFSKPQNSAPKNGSPLRQQSFPRPPERSLFSPSLTRQYTAPPLRNPAFTSARPSTPAFMTPQKDHFEDSVMSETPADDSPAMTDVSGPADTSADTPDFDDSGFLDNMHISTPDTRVSRTLFSEKKSGKGEFPNLRQGDWFQRGKVRKRVRMERDKDVGSTRSRLPDGRDEDDSDDDDDDDDRPAGRRNRRKRDMGWLHHILTSISSNPNAPMIISWYLQVLFNAACGGVVLWMAWGIISAIRGEVLYSSEKARAQLMEEMSACSRRYIENKCSPIQDRLPALEGMCNEWETCMSQDSNVVAGVKASAGHLADILNEFFSRLSWKATVTLSSFSIIAMLVCNVAFSKFRHNYEQNLHQGNSGPQYHGPGAMSFPMSPDKSQAYIFAPIGHTPKHIRRAFLQDDTESEASPDARYLPPPVTPSRIRSPIKSERSRSPTKIKLERSPSKGERSRSPSKRSPSKKLEWQ